MSLINDALKRAKQMQRQDSPSGALPLPPVERRRRGENPWNLILAAFLFISAVFLFVGAEFYRHPGRRIETAQTPGNTTPPVSTAAASAPPVSTPPVTALPVTAPPAEPVSMPVANAQPTAPDIQPTPAESDEPKPSVQGVIFSADHPVAIVNGLSVSEGTHIGNLLVKQILKTSVVFQRPDGSQMTLKIGQ